MSKFFLYLCAMTSNYHTAAFTGHRNYAHTEDEALATTIAMLYDEGVRTFRVGMAEGFDMAAAEAVMRLRAQHDDVRLEAVVPWPRFWERMGMCDRRRYEVILGVAAEVLYAAEEYSEGVFRRRNNLLVEGADVVVAWWNGRRSGTEYTVRRARKQHARVINLYRSKQLNFDF